MNKINLNEKKQEFEVVVDSTDILEQELSIVLGGRGLADNDKEKETNCPNLKNCGIY